jgi:hypothetical protein
MDRKTTASTNRARLTVTDPTRLPEMVKKMEVNVQQTDVPKAAISPM